MTGQWTSFFALVLIFYRKEILGSHVYVNINLDILPDNVSNMKIFKSNVNVTHCGYLENIGDAVFLKLGKTLTSTTCITDQVHFHIFIYHSNIRSAMITVENKETSRSIFSSMSTNIIILFIHPDYINFVVKQNNHDGSQYMGNDNRKVLQNSNLTVYSACKTQNPMGSCLTVAEFVNELNDIDKNPEILGHKINIIPSNMVPKYGLIHTCRNGGFLKTDNVTMRSECVCPQTSSFVDAGPQCEISQQRLNTPKFFYSLPNTEKLLIEFSMSIPSFQEKAEIFKIKGQNGTIFMKYTIDVNNNNHTVACLGSSTSLRYPVDRFRWLDISIGLSDKNLTFIINDEKIVTSVMELSTENLQLDTFPIIFREDMANEEINLMCLNKLRINSQFVDLYTPNYLSCAPKDCKDCLDTECLYEPLKSSVFTCICKPGFINTVENKTCYQDTNMAGQVNINDRVDMSFPPISFNTMRIKFRTVISNGNLATFSLAGYQIFVGISNGLIYSSIYNYTTQINYYNVADGQWHTVKVELKPFLLEMTLDDKIPYNSNSSWFDKDTSKNLIPQQVTNGASFGETNRTSETPTNKSTCFDTLTFISTVEFSWQINFIPLNNHLRGGCDHGINCQDLNCTNNRKCVNRWQNTSCDCIDSFTDVKGTCLFTKCISSPCLNGGTCLYSGNLQDYQCKCTDSFLGIHCEKSVFSASSSWWIILLAILVLIMILIVILTFIFRGKSKTTKSKANINQIYEDCVSYHNQAGEADYEGDPIDVEMLKNANAPSISTNESPKSLHQQLQERKEYYDTNNDDLPLDHPLDYGHEGFNSDMDSVSSFSSGSFKEDLNINSIPLQTV